MSQLIVRNLDPEIVRLLRERAAKHGRSAEAEHREILKAALAAPEQLSLKEYLLTMPPGLRASDLRRRRDKPRRVRL
jgi:plasmid stability protein